MVEAEERVSRVFGRASESGVGNGASGRALIGSGVVCCVVGPWGPDDTLVRAVTRGPGGWRLTGLRGRKYMYGLGRVYGV